MNRSESQRAQLAREAAGASQATLDLLRYLPTTKIVNESGTI